MFFFLIVGDMGKAACDVSSEITRSIGMSIHHILCPTFSPLFFALWLTSIATETMKDVFPSQNVDIRASYVSILPQQNRTKNAKKIHPLTVSKG